MSLSRKYTGIINYIFDEWLPPAIRDSKLFCMFWKHFSYKKDASRVIYFKQNLHKMGDSEYAAIYELTEDYHSRRETDLTDKCVKQILNDLFGSKILEVGCGRGFLSNAIQESNSDLDITATDIIISEKLKEKYPSIKFEQQDITNLSFADKSFDCVICSHVLEHIPNLKTAIAELRRVCKKRLILVVPRQRQYKYTFDLHINFFPYDYEFLNKIGTSPESESKIIDISRDIYYTEDAK